MRWYKALFVNTYAVLSLTNNMMSTLCQNHDKQSVFHALSRISKCLKNKSNRLFLRGDFCDGIVVIIHQILGLPILTSTFRTPRPIKISPPTFLFSLFSLDEAVPN